MIKMIFNENKLNKIKNKGFSLVELVVTIAILAFVGAVIAAFVGMSLNSYRRNSAEVNIQYQAQLAANQIGNAILSATNGISYDDSSKTLELYCVEEKNGSPDILTKVVKRFFYEPGAASVGEIKYKEIRKNMESDATIEESDDESFAKFITDFNVEIYNKEDAPIIETEDADKAGKVKIDLSYENDGRTYTETNVVTLRNEVALSTVTGAAIDDVWAFDDLATQKSTRVNYVKFSINPSKNYLWVGKDYGLASLSGETPGLNSPIVPDDSGSVLINDADVNVSNPTNETDYGFEWTYGSPGPKSADAYKDEAKTEPSFYVESGKLKFKVGKDETSPYQIVGTSRESLPNILPEDDEATRARKNAKRKKTDSVMIYPKHISNVSGTSSSTGSALDQKVKLEVGITVKYYGTENDIASVKSEVEAALGRANGATMSWDAQDKVSYSLSNDGAIACFITGVKNEKKKNEMGVMEEVPVKAQPERISLKASTKNYAKTADTVTFYYESDYIPFEEYNKYICNVVGNTLGCSIDNPIEFIAPPDKDLRKCVLGFTENYSKRLVAGESITLGLQLTDKTTNEVTPLTIDGENLKLSVTAALKDNISIGPENIGQFCTFDTSTGLLTINRPLDGSYSILIVAKYRDGILECSTKIYADDVAFDILTGDGKQFITQKEKRTQNYEFIPTGVDLPITMRVYNAGDTKKKPFDTSKYVLKLAEDCDSPAYWTPNAGVGCTLNFYYDYKRYKGVLKLELCRFNENGTTDEEKYHRLGVFQTLNIMSDNKCVNLLDTSMNTGDYNIFIPTEIRSDFDLGEGQKTSERFDNDKRINVDYYWFYDVFGNAAGYNNVIAIKAGDGNSYKPMVKVRTVEGDTFNCLMKPGVPFWIREGH